MAIYNLVSKHNFDLLKHKVKNLSFASADYDYFTEKQPITVGAIYDGAIAFDTGSYPIYRVNVEAGKTYQLFIKSTLSTPNIQQAQYTSDEEVVNVKHNVFSAVGGRTGIIINGIFTVPAGAIAMYFGVSSAYGTGTEFAIQEITTSHPSVSRPTDKLTFNGRVELDNVYAGVNQFSHDDVVEGKWVNTGGEYVTSSLTAYAHVPVLPNETILLSLGTYASSRLLAATNGALNMVAKDGTVLKTIDLGEYLNGERYNNQFVVAKFATTNETSFIDYTVKIGNNYDARETLYVAYGNSIHDSGALTINGAKLYFAEQGTLAGKKWAAVGDSLTDISTLGKYNKNYVTIVSDELGIDAKNLGVGGTGYMRTQENNTAFYQCVNAIDADTDIVTFFGSFNDISGNTTIGSINDSGTDTICGCINKTFENTIAIAPDAIICVILPTPWGGYRNSDKAKEYVNALDAIARKNGFPVLDLFHTSNLRPWDKSFCDKYYNEYLGVHPNSDAHRKYIAPRVKSLICQMID